MSVSKMETPTGQEETAILLEEQARRIATLQESLKQACHNPHSNDRVIMQEVDRLVKERDDLKRKLGNAEMLIEHLKREVKELDFSVALHDRAAKKARAVWEEAHPDKAPEWPCREDLMVWLIERVERAEAVKESLTSALGQFVEAYHKGLIGAVPDVPPAFVMDSPGHPPSPFITRNLLDEMVREAESALRTAEESSVVDRTPAKQSSNAVNADGDGDSVIDDNHLQVELDREKRKNEALYRDFKGANDLYLAENLRAEKFQDALLRIRHLLWKDLSLHDKGSLYALLLHVFSIAYKALKVEDSIDEAAAGQQKNTAGELSDCEALRELIEKKLSQRVENIKKAISSPTLSPELAALGRELVRLAEKSLGEVEG